jgi:hypothetical protein
MMICSSVAGGASVADSAGDWAETAASIAVVSMVAWHGLALPADSMAVVWAEVDLEAGWAEAAGVDTVVAAVIANRSLDLYCHRSFST